MRRRLFNVLAGTSLVIAVAIILVEIASWRAPRRINLTRTRVKDSLLTHKNLIITLDRNMMQLDWWSLESRDPETPGILDEWLALGPRSIYESHPEERDLESAGMISKPSWRWMWFPFDFRFRYRTPGYQHNDIYTSIFVILPLWLLVLIALVLPARYGIKRYRAHRRERLGLCLACGYDLRGTLAAGRSECPECGTTIKPGPSGPDSADPTPKGLA